MRAMAVRGTGFVVVVSAAAMLVACGPKYTYPTSKTREDAALDVLDCKKSLMLKQKAKRPGQAATESDEARQAAKAAARDAMERCLMSRGWKKKTE